MQTISVLWCALLCLCPAPVLCYPTGAPRQACYSMHPDHNAEAQTTAAPYTIDISAEEYTPGETTIEVTLSGSQPFKGFLLYAQRADWRYRQNVPIGKFQVVDGVQQICSTVTEEAISHTDNSDKDIIKVTWTAPTKGEGHLEFRATVVSSLKVFWENIYSKKIADTSFDSPISDIPQTTVLPVLESKTDLGAIDGSQCGSSKGCMHVPKGCSGDGCNMMLTWTQNGTTDYVYFEMMGQTSGWVAMGLSEDLIMGEDSVTECIHDDTEVTIGMAYNEKQKGASTDINPITASLNELSASYKDGIVRCNFRRNIKWDSDSLVFNLDNPYYIFLATGPAPRGVKFKHEESPVVSSSKVTLTTDTLHVSASGLTSPILRAHGIFMLTAWMVIVCTAILLSRYFKDAWPGKKLCDKKLVWFSMHRILQLIVMLLVTLGFIFAFVAVQNFTKMSNGISIAHPILGIIVMVLTIVNPIMAAFRPAANLTTKRFVFNWAHFIIGILLQILAFVNLCLGCEMPSAKTFTPYWVVYIIITFIVVYASCIIAFEVHKIWLARQDLKVKNEFELGPPNARNQSTPTTRRVTINHGHRHYGRNEDYRKLIYKSRGLKVKYIILGVFVGIGCVLYLTAFLAIATG